MTSSKEIRCEEIVVFPCPHCAGAVTLTETRDGPMALHTLEACAWFNAAVTKDFERACLANTDAKKTWEAYWRKRNAS